MLQQKLCRRIANLRRTRKLTQAQLAKLVGCSVDFVSLVERGVNAPTVDSLSWELDQWRLASSLKLPRERGRSTKSLLATNSTGRIHNPAAGRSIGC
jgi:transcriptional regulator with XRE-family HTH domain